MARELEVHVVKIRLVEREPLDAGARPQGCPGNGVQLPDSLQAAALDGYAHGAARFAGHDGEGAEGGGQPDDVGAGGRDQVELRLPGPCLEFGWRSGGDAPAGVDEHDRAGQRVCLVQVLSRQQHCRSASHEAADDVPQGVTAGRVQAGGGLVEEQDRGFGHQAQREVELAPHSSGVRLDGLLPGAAEVEDVKQPRRALAHDRPGQAVQAAAGPGAAAAARGQLDALAGWLALGEVIISQKVG
jgi:hypothetical protein